MPDLVKVIGRNPTKIPKKSNVDLERIWLGDESHPPLVNFNNPKDEFADGRFINLSSADASARSAEIMYPNLQATKAYAIRNLRGLGGNT